MEELKDRYQPASYKGVEFLVETISDTGGNRIASHEFPNYSMPYAENLGRKMRKFSFTAFLIGKDWKEQRIKLINALEGKGGILNHPIYGELNVECESYTANENIITEQLKTSLSIDFLETGKNELKIKANSKTALAKQSEFSIQNLGDIFASGYKLLQIPQTFINNIFDKASAILGVNVPYEIVSAVDALNSFLNNGTASISLPWQIPVSISALTSAFNRDYTDKGVKLQSTNTKDPKTGSIFNQYPTDVNDQTNTYTPASAYKQYMDICNVTVTHPQPLTSQRLTEYENGKRLELLIKSYSLIEACNALTEVEYPSLEDAKKTWNEVLVQFDKLLTITDEISDTHSFIELRKMRSAFMEDIQERAPTLNLIRYKDLYKSTSSLLLAYDEYEDVARDTEIITRNKIVHPGFIDLKRVELTNV